jgi:hypothetical protein
MTLMHDAEIEAFQQRDRAARPWIYQTASRRGSAT